MAEVENVLFQDDFNRINQTLKSPWAEFTRSDRAAARIVSQECTVSSVQPYSWMYESQVTWPSDCWAEMEVRDLPASSGGGEYMMVCARMRDSDDSFYGVQLRGTGSGHELVLYHRYEWTWYDLDTDATAVNVGDVIRVECRGTSIKGYVNGQERLSATNSNLASGPVGFVMSNDSGTMDDYRAGTWTEDVTPPPPGGGDYLDDFNRPDEVLDFPWSTEGISNLVMPVIRDQQATAGSIAQAAAAYIDISLPNEQWCSVEVGAIPSAYNCGIFVRRSQSTGNCYVALLEPTEMSLARYEHAGAGFVVLAGGLALPSVDDELRLEAVGSTITLKVAGAQVAQVQDTSYPSGKAGIVAQGSTGRLDNFNAGTLQLSAPAISNVNGDNSITSGQQIIVTGSNLSAINTASIEDYEGRSYDVTGLIVSATTTQVTIDPWEFSNTPMKFSGSGGKVVIGDGTNTAIQDVAVQPAADYTYFTVSGADATYGLAQDGGVDGNQYMVRYSIAGTPITHTVDTNFVIDAPVPDDSTADYWRWQSAAWEQGSILIDNDGLTPPEGVAARWVKQILPEPGGMVVGVEVSGNSDEYTTGDAPLHYTEELGELPSTLVYRTDGSWEGYPDTTREFDAQFLVANSINPTGDLSNVARYRPIMPTLSGLEVERSSIDDDSCRFRVTTPASVGTIFWICDPLGDQPSELQIEQGYNALGVLAEKSGNWQIVSPGTQNWVNVTGLQSGTVYRIWVVQRNPI